MALAYEGQSVKKVGKMFFDESDKEVLISFSTCDCCGHRFIGTEHNYPTTILLKWLSLIVVVVKVNKVRNGGLPSPSFLIN